MHKPQGGYLTALLGGVSNADTSTIRMIPREHIQPSKYNFYDVSQVDSLVDSILMEGLQSPLVVAEGEDGKFTIISGHRRFAALVRIWEEALPIHSDKLFAAELSAGEVPCLVNSYASEAEQELALIQANSNTRVLTSAELSRQAIRIEALFYKLKEQGHDFPGRMRDHVAKACEVSASKLARMKVIHDNLVEAARSAFHSEVLSESTAYALAKLPKEHQELIIKARCSGKDGMRYLYENSVTQLGRVFQSLEKASCGKKTAPCENKEGRWACYTAAQYSYKPCVDTCCGKCSQLSSCKHSCKNQEAKKQQLRTDAKEAKAQAKLAQAEADEPKVEKIAAIWQRFGEARKQSGCSVEEWGKIAGIYMGATRAEDHLKNEESAAAHTPHSNLPFSYHFGLYHALALCLAADRFGCSVDFLLCRTDDPRGGLPPSWAGGEDHPQLQLEEGSDAASTQPC